METDIWLKPAISRIAGSRLRIWRTARLIFIFSSAPKKRYLSRSFFYELRTIEEMDALSGKKSILTC
jgi:hypothetical protein